MATYTAWGTGGVANQFGPGTEPSPAWDDEAEGGPPERIWTVEADSWEDALRRYHELQGWEPYVPMGDGPTGTDETPPSEPPR